LQSPQRMSNAMQSQAKARAGPVTGLPHTKRLLTTGNSNKVNARQRAFILDIKRKRIRHLKCPTCRTAGSKARTEAGRWKLKLKLKLNIQATAGIVD